MTQVHDHVQDMLHVLRCCFVLFYAFVAVEGLKMILDLLTKSAMKLECYVAVGKNIF